MTKTLATIVIIFACIIFFPIAIGIFGGLFGIVVGIFGAIFGIVAGIFGAIFGAIGGIFGAVFGAIGGIFGFIFHSSFIALIIICLVVLAASKSRSRKS